MGVWGIYENFVKSALQPAERKFSLTKDRMKLSDLENVTRKCCELISKAKEELYIAVDNCFPQFFPSLLFEVVILKILKFGQSS